MQCTSCGAEIADKAIVCYRCGTPTAIPEAPRRQPGAPPPARRAAWPALVLLAAIVAVLAWLLPETEPGSGARTAVYAALALAIAAGAWTLVRRR